MDLVDKKSAPRLEVLAVIPARGGSKGLKRKNLRVLQGRPLVAHSIDSAKDSALINRIVVSTDDKEIANVAREYGAETIDRPSRISGDESSSEDALIHSLEMLRKTDDYTPDLVVFLQPTSPFRRHDDIDNAISLLIEAGADSAFSSYIGHFEGRWRMDSTETLQPTNYDPRKRPRRQDYPPEFIENGSIYVFRPEVLYGSGSRLGGRVVTYEMPTLYSHQVDSLMDLKIIDQIMEAHRGDYEAD